jgi:hypothetical protein
MRLAAWDTLVANNCCKKTDIRRMHPTTPNMPVLGDFLKRVAGSIVPDIACVAISPSPSFLATLPPISITADAEIGTHEIAPFLGVELRGDPCRVHPCAGMCG